jgi:cytochrome P450
VVAGADTTAIQLRAAVYYIVRTPGEQAKLQRELDIAQLSLPISYSATKNLPYLDACIQESIRIHPGVGLIIERVVPKGGVQLPDGPYLVEDTIVGINPWVLHLNEKIYGADANDFRPERWLPNEGEDSVEFAARRQAMRDTDMTFGAGDRACLGKQVAMVEIYKLLATLFLLFEVRKNPQPQ